MDVGNHFTVTVHVNSPQIEDPGDINWEQLNQCFRLRLRYPLSSQEEKSKIKDLSETGTIWSEENPYRDKAPAQLKFQAAVEIFPLPDLKKDYLYPSNKLEIFTRYRPQFLEGKVIEVTNNSHKLQLWFKYLDKSFYPSGGTEWWVPRIRFDISGSSNLCELSATYKTGANTAKLTYRYESSSGSLVIIFMEKPCDKFELTWEGGGKNPWPFPSLFCSVNSWSKDAKVNCTNESTADRP
jgi:hypothetical protein